MARAAPGRVAAEDLGQPLDLDRGREPLGIDLLDGGRVDEVDAGLAGEGEVAGLVARVAVEVLAGPELGRVDEQAHDDDVALGAGGAQEREVAVVQVAHRRHQADRATGGAGVGERVAQRALAAGDGDAGLCACGSADREVHQVHALRGHGLFREL